MFFHNQQIRETRPIKKSGEKIFKEENSDCKDLKTVVLDEDFAKISAIKEVFPQDDLFTTFMYLKYGKGSYHKYFDSSK